MHWGWWCTRCCGGSPIHIGLAKERGLEWKYCYSLCNLLHNAHSTAQCRNRRSSAVESPVLSKGNAYKCASSRECYHESSSLDPIEISDTSDPDPVCDWWIQALHLYQDDKTSLLCQRELTENIINAAHILLSLQFPHIAGLQDTILGHHLDYVPISSDIYSVQILHTG